MVYFQVQSKADLQWCNVGIIKGTSHVVTHYFLPTNIGLEDGYWVFMFCTPSVVPYLSAYLLVWFFSKVLFRMIAMLEYVQVT